jgi:anaerobic dimethyl sulfoxide reductase subunit B (iron-sulfur subunit)
MMRYGLLVDYEFCTGCQSCEVACKQEHGFPVGKWGIRVLDEGPWPITEKNMNWNKIPTPTNLCDLCKDRIEEGKDPSCVHHCLAQVMMFGPLEELLEALDRKPKQVLFVPC